MNVLAAALAGIVSWQLGGWAPLFCILACIVLLYCYSAFFKKQFLIGNILVAGISASAMPVLTLAESHTPVFFPKRSGTSPFIPYYIPASLSSFPLPVNW